MATHVIKYEYKNGKSLKTPEVWCGRKLTPCSTTFQNAQHAALAVGGSMQPCKNCIKAIIKQLGEEL
jgi:hypothetical protein